ncbi:leukocyte elastase inhibitor-like, partial [Uloborus diversus]|uniref:leukocyte elastase inhibitor-like n=1 Tax=Uloborus diversus TaxID=327109 RepID=UPI0024099D7B
IIFLSSVLVVSTFGQCFQDVDYVPTKQKLLSNMEHFFDASNRFAIKLLHAINNTKDTFLSPFSIWTSMILVYLGSKGTTEKELEGMLNLQGMDKSIVAYSYSSLKLWFSSKLWYSSSASFSMINNLFLQKDVKIRKCLLEFLEDDLAYVDFHKNPELARISINFLIQRYTKNKIKDILPPHSLHTFTEFLVTSAMHFKGAWIQPFFPQATQPRAFFTSQVEYKLVDMMVTRNTFLYAVSDELQCTAIELPYVGRSLTMVIMLPKNKAHGVQILISSLTPVRMNDLMEDMFPREVVVVMPKFQLEDRQQLSSAFLKLGFRDLAINSLDLTGFSTEIALNINEIYHKAFISVNEEGTEAAAGTITALSRNSRPTRTIDFIVDHPFVFFIRENLSGSILFMGIIRNPNHPTQ